MNSSSVRTVTRANKVTAETRHENFIHLFFFEKNSSKHCSNSVAWRLALNFFASIAPSSIVCVIHQFVSNVLRCDYSATRLLASPSASAYLRVGYKTQVDTGSVF